MLKDNYSFWIGYEAGKADPSPRRKGVHYAPWTWVDAAACSFALAYVGLWLLLA